MSARWGSFLKYYLGFLYSLCLLLVIALLVRQWQGDDPAFFVTNQAVKADSDTLALSIFGENFHSEMKGVSMKTLLNEEAVRSYHLAGLPLRLLDVSDNLVLASYHQNKVVSMSYEKDEKPKVLGSITLSERVGQIKIVGNKALVGMTLGGGADLLDVSNPENMQLIAHYPLSGSVNNMVAQGSTIYFTGLKLGLARLDLSVENPVPEILADLESSWSIAVHDDKIAVGTLDGRVHLFEIDRQGEVTEVHSLDFPSQVRGVTWTNDALAVASADQNISTFHIKNWPSLVNAGVLRLPGQALNIERLPGQTKVFVNLLSGGFALVQIDKTRAPVLSAWHKSPRTYRDFHVSAGEVIGAGSEGLDVVSFAEAEKGDFRIRAPEAIIDEAYYFLKPWGDYVYGSTRRGTTQIIGKAPTRNLSFSHYLPIVDPDKRVVFYRQFENGQLQKSGSLRGQENVLDAKIADDYLYVLHDDGLKIVSFEQPEKTRIVSELPLPGSLKMFDALNSETLVVPTDDQGLLLVDVSDPAAPKRLSQLLLPRYRGAVAIRDMLIDRDRVFLSMGEGGVLVIDVSAPQQPELIKFVDTLGYTGKMDLYDGLLLVADGLDGLFVIDVEDRNAVFPVGTLDVPARIHQMAVANDGLIVSSRKGGTMKLPLPQRLNELRLVSEEEVAVDVDAPGKGMYVYLYDDRVSERIALDVR